MLLRLARGRARPAIALQAALFALWHARAFLVVGVAPALAALLVLFVGGVLWGWQVWRDRTLAYAALQHTIFLIVQ